MHLDEGVNRRRFIGVGGMALALATLPLAWGVEDAVTPYRAIFDERFAAGRAFGAAAVRRGWTARAISGDITKIWFRELAPHWRTSPAMIMGVTTSQTLFVIERLSWDAGLRVTRRDVDATASVVRWVIGPRVAEPQPS